MSSPSTQIPSRVGALRSQFESFDTTKKTMAPKPVKNEKVLEDNMDTEDNDDVCSNYGDDDNTGAVVEESHDSGYSTPEHYVEIAATNPYNEEGRDSSEEQHKGKYLDLTKTVPARRETMEEALDRLSKELEVAHQEIEEGQAAVLRYLQTLPA